MSDLRHIAALASQIKNPARRRLLVVEAAIALLKQEDLRGALRLVDISCHDKVPAAEDLLLRSEILRRLGADDPAAHDIEIAFDIDPMIPAVQLRQLDVVTSRGDKAEANRLAGTLLRLDLRAAVAGQCARAIFDSSDTSAVGHCLSTVPQLRFRFLARAKTPIEMTFHFDKGSRREVIRPAEACAGDQNLFSGIMSVAWPSGATVVAIEPSTGVWISHRAVYRRRPNSAPLSPALNRQHRASDGSVAPTRIIIPVYAGLDETVACINSVLVNTNWASARLLLVEDQSPDRDLSKALTSFDAHPAVTILRNPANLGFIGSINRALAAFPRGDVVLLNADTLVGAGWLDRLRKAAHSAPNVGTVTPLSNNGELTSVPRPFDVSVMPDCEDLAAINERLALMRDGETCTIPNGIGFCLYITEACRQEVGLLNDRDFVDGYLEEVDFCLRASAKNFRHLCALDTFVAHKGGTSFKDRRRSLVVRNLKQLERKFPHIRRITHEFMQTTTLQEVASDVQLALLDSDGGRLIHITLAIGSDLDRLRCHQDDTPGDDVLSLTFSPHSSKLLHLSSSNLLSPASLHHTLASNEPARELSTLLKRFAIQKVLIDCSSSPSWISEFIINLARPVEFVLSQKVTRRMPAIEILKDLIGRPIRFEAIGFSDLSLSEFQGLRLKVPVVLKRLDSLQSTATASKPDDAAIALLLEDNGPGGERAVERLAKALLQHSAPPDIVVICEPGPPLAAERLGIVRRLVRPAATSLRQALSARGVHAAVHLSDEDCALTKWSADIMAAGLPLMSTSPYIAAQYRSIGARFVHEASLGEAITSFPTIDGNKTEMTIAPPLEGRDVLE